MKPAGSGAGVALASEGPAAELVAMRRSSEPVRVKRLVSARRVRSVAVVCALAAIPAPAFAWWPTSNANSPDPPAYLCAYAIRSLSSPGVESPPNGSL